MWSEIVVQGQLLFILALLYWRAYLTEWGENSLLPEDSFHTITTLLLLCMRTSSINVDVTRRLYSQDHLYLTTS